MDYIVTADYYDWRGLYTLSRYWVIDDNYTSYEVKGSEGKVKELILQIKSLANENEDIGKVDIDVYELGSKVMDKCYIKWRQ